MAESIRIVIADRGDAGVRLDLVLRRHLRGADAASRTRVQAWIEGGHVTVNGAAVRRPSARTALGDRVCVSLPEPKPRRPMTGEDVPLDVLYEDDHLLAIDKPPGVVVHPAYKHPTGTLMNALVARARRWPAGQRPSIVGRLDKGTSGIVLVAKTAAVHAALQRAGHVGRPFQGRPSDVGRPFQSRSSDVGRPFQSRSSDVGRPFQSRSSDVGRPFQGRLVKEYLAIVRGRPPARGRIDVPLGLDARDRRRVIASDAGAPSVTDFVRLGRGIAFDAPIAVVKCTLVTGRRHQIRVHLASRGWPIVGDAAYGGGVSFPRPALHAWRTRLMHPVTGEPLRIESPIPVDMLTLIERGGIQVTEGTERTD